MEIKTLSKKQTAQMIKDVDNAIQLLEYKLTIMSETTELLESMYYSEIFMFVDLFTNIKVKLLKNKLPNSDWGKYVTKTNLLYYFGDHPDGLNNKIYVPKLCDTISNRFLLTDYIDARYGVSFSQDLLNIIDLYLKTGSVATEDIESTLKQVKDFGALIKSNLVCLPLQLSDMDVMFYNNNIKHINDLFSENNISTELLKRVAADYYRHVYQRR